MKRLGTIITNQSMKLLENKQYAILLAVTLSVMPFASWLSVALVALVSLRKGAKAGFEVMLPALVIHSVPLMMMVPVDTAISNTLIAYLPCYISALTLRKTNNWQWVCGILFLQALVACVMIQVFAPELIIDQFNQFKLILAQYQEYQQLISASNGVFNSNLLAQFFFSIQMLSIVVTTAISLLFARSIQSKLFVPGGYTKELLRFRSGKLALVPLIVIAIASYYQNPIAINVLPLALGYFLLSGFSLAYFLLARKQQVKVFILLIMLIMLKPSFVLAAYVLAGSLDSIFNFRLLLPTRLREST